MTDLAIGRSLGREIVLAAANFKLRSSISAADASPFLGHHKLDDAQNQRTLAALHSLTRNDIERFIGLFRLYPLVCSWIVATAIAESYGQDGDTRIYSLIEKKLGCLPLCQAYRQSLNRAFRETCLRFGLPVTQRRDDGHDWFVDDYIIQAGVAYHQLKHLAAAFLHGELEFGSPPVDDTVQLSAWAQAAAQEFMSDNLPRPRRVIDHDDVGYHASVFARLSRSAIADTPFERAFTTALEEARQTNITGPGQAAPRPPNLAFVDGELSLQNSSSGSRVVVSINGRDRSLAPGSRIDLGSPWPALVSWRSGNDEPKMIEIAAPGDLLVFDTDQGRLLFRIKAGVSSVTLDSVGAVLVSSRAFAAGEDQSYQVGPEAHVLYISLEKPVQVQLGGRRVNLNMLDRPRLIVEGETVASATGAPLIAAPALVRVFAGPDLLSQKMMVRAEHPALGTSLQMPVVKNEVGEYRSNFNGLPASGEFGPLRLSLHIDGQQRTIAKTFFWYWPGLRQLDTGVIFDAASIPHNFDKEVSRNVVIGSKGKLELADRSDYLTAHLAFKVGSDRVIFSIPKPGLTLAVAIPNLPERPIAIGSDLLVGDSLDGSLVIRTPDYAASLDVCGRTEHRPFVNSGVRRIAMASLLSKESHNRIRFMPRGDAALAQDILTVVGATDPEVFELTCQANFLRASIKFRAAVDAVRVEFHHLNSDLLMVSETAIGRYPVALPSTPSVACSQKGADRKDLYLRLDRNGLQHGEWLASVKVREEGKESWQSLTNARLDEFSFGFEGNLETSEHSDIADHFLRLDRALVHCFSIETWPSIEQTIIASWKAAGANLASAPDRRHLIRASGHAPPASASPSWVPIHHPLELAPDLFECPPDEFQAFSDAPAEGADHLARVSRLAACTRVREVGIECRSTPSSLLASPISMKPSRMTGYA